MYNKIYNIEYKEYRKEELAEIDKNLIEMSEKSARRAYAPYSHFKVGAAALLENGEIITGSNQENAASPSGICAERTTLFYANAKYPDAAVKTLAITAIDSNDNIVERVITPCGACRQVILEVENRYNSPCRLLLSSKDTVLEFSSIKDLLPFSFGKDDLK